MRTPFSSAARLVGCRCIRRVSTPWSQSFCCLLVCRFVAVLMNKKRRSWLHETKIKLILIHQYRCQSEPTLAICFVSDMLTADANVRAVGLSVRLSKEGQRRRCGAFIHEDLGSSSGNSCRLAIVLFQPLAGIRVYVSKKWEREARYYSRDKGLQRVHMPQGGVDRFEKK